jgi:hypothetical protein
MQSLPHTEELELADGLFRLKTAIRGTTITLGFASGTNDLNFQIMPWPSVFHRT